MTLALTTGWFCSDRACGSLFSCRLAKFLVVKGEPGAAELEEEGLVGDEEGDSNWLRSLETLPALW